MGNLQLPNHDQRTDRNTHEKHTVKHSSCRHRRVNAPFYPQTIYHPLCRKAAIHNYSTLESDVLMTSCPLRAGLGLPPPPPPPLPPPPSEPPPSLSPPSLEALAAAAAEAVVPVWLIWLLMSIILA